MATTITLEIKKAPTSKGRFPIFIRITKDRKHKRIKTSIELNHLADWNPKGAKNQNWVRASERNAATWNDALAKELEAVRALEREDKTASATALALKAKNLGASNSFLAYAKATAEEMGTLGRSSAKHFVTFCNKLESFLISEGRQDLYFSEVTPALVASFESFLLKESNAKIKEERRLHPNYVRTLLVKFRTIVNKAINQELMPADKYPFRSHPIPKEVTTGREALDESEVDAIVSLDYPANTWCWNARNTFLFSYYCAGIRVGDLLQLRWRNIRDDGTRLEYVMGKNHKYRNYPLMPQAKELLALYRTDASQPSDYIFPLLDSSAAYAKDADIDTLPVDLKKALLNQVYSKTTLLNRNLKKVAQDAGIDKTLSFHISRHTFASIARQKGVSSMIVQKALAHSSLSTTERYLHSFSTEEVDNALQQVFATDKKQDDLFASLLKSMDDMDGDTNAVKKPKTRKRKLQALMEALAKELEAIEREENRGSAK